MVSRTTLLRELRIELDQTRRQHAESAEHTARLAKAVEHLEGVIEHLGANASEPEMLSQPAKTVRNAMLDIFREHGAPLHYKDLHRLLLERNVEVNGKDPARTVGAHLSNDQRFKSLGAGFWGLDSWPASVNAIRPAKGSPGATNGRAPKRAPEPDGADGAPVRQIASSEPPPSEPDPPDDPGPFDDYGMYDDYEPYPPDDEAEHLDEPDPFDEPHRYALPPTYDGRRRTVDLASRKGGGQRGMPAYGTPTLDEAAS